MPPKRSKADREKLKKEAAERKAQEEEEQRLREEEEAREREKRERQEREEETRRQALIDAHLREERGSLNEEEGKRRQQLEEWKRERSMRREWEHYISCNTLPLVTEEKPLNSWLSRHGDNKVSSVEETLKDIKDYLFLVREIEAAVIGDGQPLPTEEKKAYYMETLLQMKHTTLSKLSSLAHHCLVNAEKYLHPETFNLSMETSIPGELALCIWGNVVKNPRLKNFSFDYRSFTLELPKPLVLADVAIRVLYPPFDYLSPLSRSYACKSPPFTYTEREAPTNHGNNKVAVEYSGGDEKVEGNQLSTDQEAKEGGEQEQGGGGGGGGGEIEEKEEGGDLSEAGKKEVNGEGEKKEEEVNEEGRKEREEAGEEEEEEEMEEDEIDLRSHGPAGGLVVMEILELPSPAKTVGQWTVRKVSSPHLRPYTYPQELMRSTQEKPVEGVESEEQEAPPTSCLPGSAQWPPVTVSMSLPSPFLFPQEPSLARWDSEHHIWRTDGLKDIRIDMEERTVSFQTYYFSPFAFMVDRYANMPYQSWSVIPQAPNHTHLQLTGANIDITVEIKDHWCALIGPTEEPAVTHLVNKSMTAWELINALKRCGVNFSPEYDGHKYVSITDKHPHTEYPLYHYMSLVSSCFALQWSQWNECCGRDKCVVQAAECVGKKEEELKWCVYQCGQEQCWRLDVGEDSETFSEQMADGCEPHAHLYSLLLSEASPAAKQVLSSSSTSSSSSSSSTSSSSSSPSSAHTEAVHLFFSQARFLTYS